jgi:hypothetical protein
MINKIFIDIETIPTQAPGAIDHIRAKIKAPAKLSAKDSIAKWHESPDKETAIQEEYRKTALNGTTGEIVCIGWAINDEPVKSLYRKLGESEQDLLDGFFGTMDAVTKSRPLWIGHNIIGFDLRFLYHRAVINYVDPRQPLPHDTRYNGEKVFDTMLGWAGWGNRISLVNLCAALGIKVKLGDITGATVWDAMQAGRGEEVAEYCREDVSATRAVYERMTFGK